MANTWTTLLDAVYPVGAVYQSWSSTSPATLFGGTWTQIKGAFLGATGANSFASAGELGGSLKIARTQLPQHAHTIGNFSSISSIDSWDTTGISPCAPYVATSRRSTYTKDSVNISTSGICPIIDGDVAYVYSGTTNWVSPLYAMQAIGPSGNNYLPYHYGCYTWRRTA